MSQDLQNICSGTKNKILSKCYDYKHESNFESKSTWESSSEKKNLSRERENADQLCYQYKVIGSLTKRLSYITT